MKSETLTVYTARVSKNEETGELTHSQGVVSIPNTLEAMQGFVGGWVECVTLSDNIALWVHEEGKMIGLPRNFAILDARGVPLDVIVGDAFFTAADTDDEGNTLSITPEGIEEARALVQEGLFSAAGH